MLISKHIQEDFVCDFSIRLRSPEEHHLLVANGSGSVFFLLQEPNRASIITEKSIRNINFLFIGHDGGENVFFAPGTK